MANTAKFENIEFLKSLQESGQQVPFLDKMPKILPQDKWIWEGFCILNSCRTYEGRRYPQALTLSDIVTYLDCIGVVSHSDRYLFLNVIKYLDGHYLENKREALYKKEMQERKKQSARSSGKRK